MRADAVRNKKAVLHAAGRLFDAAGDSEQVSMDDIAAAAGLGKGTLFRRFGDRASLIRALYEERAEELHEVLARDREGGDDVIHLMSTVLRFKIENRALSKALESIGDGSPYANAGYDRWHSTLVQLLTEARGPDDADFLAHALLSAVRSDLVQHLSDWPEARLQAGLTALVCSVVHGSAVALPIAAPD